MSGRWEWRVNGPLQGTDRHWPAVVHEGGRYVGSLFVASEDDLRMMIAAPELLAALDSLGVLSATPEWVAKRNAAIARAKGGDDGR